MMFCLESQLLSTLNNLHIILTLVFRVQYLDHSVIVQLLTARKTRTTYVSIRLGFSSARNRFAINHKNYNFREKKNSQVIKMPL